MFEGSEPGTGSSVEMPKRDSAQEAGTRPYNQVAPEQAERLFSFRRSHTYSRVRAGGSTWRYIGCGRGEPALLLLPGAFLEADMWFNQILALENDFRIITPDAYALQGVFDIEVVCRALVSSLDAEGIERATVVGVSAGGAVAQVLLQMAPERVERVVFSHCGVLRQSNEADRRTRWMLGLVNLLPLAVIRRVLKSMTSGDLPASSEWAAFHEAYMAEALSKIDKRAVVGFLRSGLAIRRRFRFDPDAIASWHGSILILSSRDDPLSRDRVEELAARYPQAWSQLLQKGGHHAFLFFPEAYTKALQRFLSETSECQSARPQVPAGRPSR